MRKCFNKQKLKHLSLLFESKYLVKDIQYLYAHLNSTNDKKN